MTRFLSPDPVRGNVFSPQSLNLFAYVGGNPTNFVDPWGLMPQSFAPRYLADEVDVFGEDPCPEAPKGMDCDTWEALKKFWEEASERHAVGRYDRWEFLGDCQSYAGAVCVAQGNLWVESSSPHTLAVLQEVAVKTDPLMDYWQSVFATELFWLAGGPADEAFAWLFSRHSPVFGLGRGLSTGNQWLRVGWSNKWKNRYTFRLSGRLIDWIKGEKNAHINLWKGPRVQ